MDFRQIAALTGLIGALSLGGSPASAQDTDSPFGLASVASVTYGPYARLEFGAAEPDFSGAFWQPPGFPSDPQVNFALDGEIRSFGALAVGFDWQNGVRADLSLFGTGSSAVTGPCSSASDATPCSIHADISDAHVKTRGIMGNVYFAPREWNGSNAIFQPFVVAGLGIARNEISPWTRENAASAREFRTFEGDTQSGLAWSIGIGASLQITRPGRWPIILEGTLRHYDFGEAAGGSVPLPGNGSGEPVAPLTFDLEEQVLTIGIRIPLQRL